MENTKKKAGDDDQKICRKRSGHWKCKNVSDDNDLEFCERHYKNFTDFFNKRQLIDSKVKEMKKLPTDEERCCRNDGGKWRCKNFRMSSVDTKYCEEHYYVYITGNQEKYKKRSRDGEGAGAGSSASIAGIEVTRGSKRKKKKIIKEDDGSLGVTEATQPATTTVDTSYNIEEGGSAYISRKRENDERSEKSGEIKSLTKTSREPVVETRDHSNCSKRRRKVKKDDQFVYETGIQQTANDICDVSDTIMGGTANIRRKRKIVERTKGSGEPESSTRTSREPVVELGSLEHYKSKCCELSVELEKRKMECIKLQGKLVEVETRKTAAADETAQSPADANECWRKMFSDLANRILSMLNSNSTMAECLESRFSKLESQVQCIENKNSMKMGCLESRILKLESLISRMGNENLAIGGCVQSHTSNMENLRNGKESSKLNCVGLRNPEKTKPETGGLQNDVSQSGEQQTGDKKSAFVNLVSDEESEDSDLKFPTGGLVDMLGMENGNRNKNEMKWESEADMLSSFEMDAEVCMKAVCALYRQKISEDEIPPQGLYYQSDTLRCITLAKFLMDKDCEGALKKSVKELETLDSKAAYDCKRLAKRYSIFLFDIYKNRKDPYFLPGTTARHTSE